MFKSKFIKNEHINSFQQLKEAWDKDPKAFDRDWAELVEAEDDLFVWVHSECAKMAEILGTRYKLPESSCLQIADDLFTWFIYGIFFGEMRWHRKEDFDLKTSFEKTLGA